MRTRLLWLGLLLLAGIVFLAGRKDSTRPVLAHGTATLDGQPLVLALVTFHPVEESRARPASGMTAEDGTFQLSTSASSSGVLPGRYKVCLVRVKAEIEHPRPVTDVPLFLNGEFLTKDRSIRIAPTLPPAPRPPIPPCYAEPSATPLEVTVTARSAWSRFVRTAPFDTQLELVLSGTGE